MGGERREHRQALSVVARIRRGVCVKQWRIADTNLFFPGTKKLALDGSDFVLGVASQRCKQPYTFEGL